MPRDRRPPAHNPATLTEVQEAVRQLTRFPPTLDNFNRPNKAGVLAGLFHCKKRGLTLIMTQRSSKLRSHSGEVAFPGGKWDSTDDSIIATAIREANEEIGLDPAHVHYLTTLPPNVSRINSLVYPVVAHLYPHLEGTIDAETFIVQYLEPNPDEVEAIFAVPLIMLVRDGPEHSSFDMQWLGTKWRFHEFMYAWPSQEAVEEGSARDKEGAGTFRVWGLTGGFAIYLAMIALDCRPDFEWMAPGQADSVAMVRLWKESNLNARL
ncbi:NUDIX hydrolase domain-like protein [Catenaria anguillulae PL171]|uniref:NUDIX hydrolase domain-like protein n=1 Tax=Catenaria anguillulae PL171 TaxID=765915 RepID=A0A1Y2HER2_9FUNG|nr:NUDIX hydrolase domain-like protein [Catenaria anguillulae PL171]